MACTGERLMPAQDPFASLASFYDPLMEHVDYERWQSIVRTLAALIPEPFLHVDAGCGTGTLVAMLREKGWRSAGIDLSQSMVRAGHAQRPDLPLAAADIRALPFSGNLGLLTCLFDSMNFLLEEEDFCTALCEFSGSLRPGGLLYFDVVTERMVTEHFEDQTWTEKNQGFTSTWSSTYDRATAVANTRVLIHGGEWASLHERIYPTDWIAEAVNAAGLQLLGYYDAMTWKKPKRQTTRIDFVAVKPPAPDCAQKFEPLPKHIQKLLNE